MKMFKKIFVLVAAALVAGSMFISCGDKYAEAKAAFVDEFEGYVKELEDLVEGDTKINTNSQLDFLQDLQNKIATIGNEIASMETNEDYKDLPDPSTWKGELKEKVDALQARFNELMESATKQISELSF